MNRLPSQQGDDFLLSMSPCNPNPHRGILCGAKDKKAMKRKSRHKRHVELLKKLVDKTDYFVGHVWNDFGKSMHGRLDWRGRQTFVLYGDHCNTWLTPWLGKSRARHIFFAVMPKMNDSPFSGIILDGWKELNWYVKEQIAQIAMKEWERNGKGTL